MIQPVWAQVVGSQYAQVSHLALDQTEAWVHRQAVGFQADIERVVWLQVGSHIRELAP